MIPFSKWISLLILFLAIISLIVGDGTLTIDITPAQDSNVTVKYGRNQFNFFVHANDTRFLSVRPNAETHEDLLRLTVNLSSGYIAHQVIVPLVPGNMKKTCVFEHGLVFVETSYRCDSKYSGVRCEDYIGQDSTQIGTTTATPDTSTSWTTTLFVLFFLTGAFATAFFLYKQQILRLYSAALLWVTSLRQHPPPPYESTEDLRMSAM